MTLHPDILTDLVILYHAGEASLATRTFLETEARANPHLAGALAAPPRPAAALPVDPPDILRGALRDIRILFRRRLYYATGTSLLLGVAISVPQFYERDAGDLPRRWILTMKHAMRVAGQQFTARRMVEQYATSYYAPSILGDVLPDDPPTA